MTFYDQDREQNDDWWQSDPCDCGCHSEPEIGPRLIAVDGEIVACCDCALRLSNTRIARAWRRLRRWWVRYDGWAQAWFEGGRAISILCLPLFTVLVLWIVIGWFL